MTDPKTFDFCVLGAGLAGLATAKHLLLRGADVALIDPFGVAAGASGTPLGMVNPATGRYGTMAWEAESCLRAVTEDLKLVQDESPSAFFKNTGILRPAQDKKMASRMHENAHKPDWPEEWCQWLNRDEVVDINPDLHCVDGGMWLPKGLTVNVGAYLDAKAGYLEKQGLSLYTQMNYDIEKAGSAFLLQLADGSSLQCDQLIFTSGYDLTHSKYWDFIPLNPVKGQIAIFKSPVASEFDYSISALGYLASLSDKRFVAGSTYEHHFEDREPDAEGLAYLIKRLSKVYPRLFEHAALEDQWAGVRASTPNRKPFVGPHPKEANMFVYAGLGSKGLLYSEYLAQLLTESIFDQKSLPEEISTHRI